MPEFFRLLGLLSAFIISFSNYTLLTQILLTHTKWSTSKLDVISFLFIFLSILFIFKILAIVSNLFLHSENFYSFTRLIGLLLGFARGILLVSLFYTLFINSPFLYLSTSAKDRSLSSQYISDVAPSVYKIGIGVCPFQKVETPLAKLLELS